MHMSKALAAPLLFLLSLPGIGQAQEDASAPDPGIVVDEAMLEEGDEAEASPAPPVPLLWRVSDADNTLYLLGAFHLLKEDDHPLSTDVEAAFEDAEKLVFEVPAAQLADPATPALFLQTATYADGRGLSDVLSPETYEKLESVLGDMGLPGTSFDTFEPWFVNLSLVMTLAQPMGFNGEYGLDQYFMGRAQAAGKPSSGLETVARQLEVLDGIPMEEQVVGLAELIDDPDAMAQQLDELHAAWRNGDADTLERLAIDEMRETTPETYQRVNIERNADWLPKLQAMLDESDSEDVLVVVGAMHLLGEDGLIDALRAAGRDVERICSACEAE